MTVTGGMEVLGVKRNQFDVPCGRHQFTDAQPAIEHAAGCASCSVAQRAAGLAGAGPRPGSTIARKTGALQVVEVLEAYSRCIDKVDDTGAPDASRRQVERLAHVVGVLEVMLDAETNGRAGDPHSSGPKVLARYQAPQGS